MFPCKLILFVILENSDQGPETSNRAFGELRSCLRRILIESPENSDPGPGEPRSWPGEPVYAHRARGRAQRVVTGEKIIMAAMSVDLLLHFKANLSSCWTVSLNQSYLNVSNIFFNGWITLRAIDEKEIQYMKFVQVYIEMIHFMHWNSNVWYIMTYKIHHMIDMIK